MEEGVGSICGLSMHPSRTDDEFVGALDYWGCGCGDLLDLVARLALTAEEAGVALLCNLVDV